MIETNLYVYVLKLADGSWCADWYPDGAGHKRSSKTYPTRAALLEAMYADPNFWIVTCRIGVEKERDQGGLTRPDPKLGGNDVGTMRNAPTNARS